MREHDKARKLRLLGLAGPEETFSAAFGVRALDRWPQYHRESLQTRVEHILHPRGQFRNVRKEGVILDSTTHVRTRTHRYTAVALLEPLTATIGTRASSSRSAWIDSTEVANTPSRRTLLAVARAPSSPAKRTEGQRTHDQPTVAASHSGIE